MDTLASSSNSSIDILAAANNDPRSSPVRDLDRIFDRSSSPSKIARTTPTRNNTYQLQDFYLTTPTQPRSISTSPARSLVEAENVISPWRIRVRVEAEREEAPYDNEFGRLARNSMSPYPTRSRATTMVVPLNDYSDPNTTPKSPGRAKKSTPKRRRPTPNPQRSKKRVLASVENEASNRLPSPKRLKQNNAPGLDHQERVLDEGEETTILQLDDLVEAALIGDADHQLNSVREIDTETPIEGMPSVNSTAQDTTKQNRFGKAQRATSPFKFRRQGQESSVSQTSSSLSSNVRSRRRLLISDFAEPHQEFDSVVEGEDFSMVSLSSVPSAQQHLSLRKENANVATTNTSTRVTDLQRRRSELRSHAPSPGMEQQPGTLRAPPQSLKYPKLPKLPDEEISPAQSKESRQHSRLDGALNKGLNSDDPAGYGDQNGLPSSSGHDLPADDEHAEDFGFGDDSDQLGVVLPEIIDFNGADEDSVYSGEESPQPTQQNANLDPIEEHDSADDNFLRAGDYQPREQELENPIGIVDGSIRAIESKLDKSNDPKNNSYLEQSSMLQLLQDKGTPSQVFSSPTLPNMLPQQNGIGIKPLQEKVVTPQLKRVAKAGKALQGVVEPAIEQQSLTMPEEDTAERQQSQPDDLFSGFSISTRRELRAGLRLGNELAKRHSSLMDITMHTVSSQDRIDILPNADASASHGKTIGSYGTDSLKQDALPVLFVEENTQLPSPEISSNATDNRTESVLIHGDNSHDNGKPTFNAEKEHNIHLQEIPNGTTEDDFLEAADGLDFQDQGFASDSEPETHNAANELTDIWQLAADSTSFLQDPISQHASLLPTDKDTDLFSVGLDHPRSLPEAVAEEEEDTESVLHHSVVDDFDQESIESPRVHDPTALSDVLTPSDTKSSSHMDARPNQVEFTDFTGFTKDLLQAAANRDKRQHLNNRISEEREEQATPSEKIPQGHRTYQADVFMTKSYLDTSPASIKTRRFSPRKPISFRPTNRKESWLFDPSRLRKPPSPQKQAIPSSTSSRAERDPSDPTLSGNHGNIPQHARTLQADHSDSELSEHSSSIGQHQDLSSGSSQSTNRSAKSSNHGFSPKVPALVAQKDRFRHPQTIYTTAPTSKASQVKNNPAKPIAALPPTQRLQQKARPNAGNRPTHSSPVSQISDLSSQQSSFISNVSSNTSYDANETQPTWLSFLTTVATPLITSTKAVTSLAANAFRHSQHQTFYPMRKTASLTPAILTTHMPFNDAHWSALQMLYTAGLLQTDKLTLDLTHPCADYLGLEIESLGWKRELKEWELAVVAGFLHLLDEEGIVEDAEQDSIDVEDVVKRVFSLWVGMVTRGELEMTNGTAGAWDRRFVGRRDAVLRKQRDWLRTHQ
ncbi:MAG: hypothetical protein GOMPHAMPRED_004107 [Gomphillus americanus]|uniref:Uncharacterized protein n=1 Tax=Gomphillus americanus TaxID=1940652 RepID=A0A8H3IMF1_9LECA|nr:MAG: hypothetical protein GOMPHAMPRED_004107 [Gomphillus americanus]